MPIDLKWLPVVVGHRTHEEARKLRASLTSRTSLRLSSRLEPQRLNADMNGANAENNAAIPICLKSVKRSSNRTCLDHVRSGDDGAICRRKLSAKSRLRVAGFVVLVGVMVENARSSNVDRPPRPLGNATSSGRVDCASDEVDDGVLMRIRCPESRFRTNSTQEIPLGSGSRIVIAPSEGFTAWEENCVVSSLLDDSCYSTICCDNMSVHLETTLCCPEPRSWSRCNLAASEGQLVSARESQNPTQSTAAPPEAVDESLSLLLCNLEDVMEETKEKMSPKESSKRLEERLCALKECDKDEQYEELWKLSNALEPVVACAAMQLSQWACSTLPVNADDIAKFIVNACPEAAGHFKNIVSLKNIPFDLSNEIKLVLFSYCEGFLELISSEYRDVLESAVRASAFGNVQAFLQMVWQILGIQGPNDS